MWKLLRDGGLLAIVCALAHFLQPFLSGGLATNKFDTMLFKKPVIQIIIIIQNNKQTNNNLNFEICYAMLDHSFFFPYWAPDWRPPLLTLYLRTKIQYQDKCQNVAEGVDFHSLHNIALP